ncbi:MAG TPA: SUMF1/EgtB/PvdO family nonheme iron enzyme [Alphaproteobacteria bacterium]|nr:SUMF1/EgtB/PvdO family nonheme iron enzyme [Alphaproteobacteria bacterium]
MIRYAKPALWKNRLGTSLMVGGWLSLSLWLAWSVAASGAFAGAPTASSPVTDEGEMVLIPAGEFTMGHPGSYDTQPVGRIPLPAFYIDKYEVTNKRYKRFIDATGHKVPWSLEPAAEPYKWDWQARMYPTGKGDDPVVLVSWEDAKAFCAWAGKSLPTEAQWEKAARGANGKSYPWGNDWLDKHANTIESGLRQTSPVGMFERDISEYGVYDMAGNVSEWVEDWFVMYSGNSFTNYDAGEKYKVLRGGSWDYFKSIATGYHRQYALPHSQMTAIGFRCAKAADGSGGTSPPKAEAR